MPLRQTIVGQAVVRAIIAEVVEKALLHIGRFGVRVNVAQGIQRAAKVAFLEAAAVVAFLPEMPRSVQHPVKTHGGVPIEPVHDFG